MCSPTCGNCCASAGYNVLTSNNLHDSLILLKAARPHLTVRGPNLKAAPGAEQAFLHSTAGSPVVELGDEFSTLDAGQAASELLEKIRVTGQAPAPGTVADLTS